MDAIVKDPITKETTGLTAMPRPDIACNEDLLQNTDPLVKAITTTKDRVTTIKRMLEIFKNMQNDTKNAETHWMTNRDIDEDYKTGVMGHPFSSYF